MEENRDYLAEEFAVSVVLRLREAGHDALWAGGCVRDRLLGKQPKDYDVATSATPDQVCTVFGARRTLRIGEAFGVVAVLGKKPLEPIEVATFREEAGYTDGRHPDQVSFSTHRIFVVLEQIEINQTHFFLEGGNIPEGEQIQIP